MIQTKSEFQIIADDNMSSAKFSIKDENLAQVFDILRNRLYSNKILAVIREYSTNAYDANVEAGKPDMPIQVTLPTIIDPVFKVRDFGPGLSEHDIYNIFSSYGASTKRDTNLQVGALGMGSKSAFGYTDSFTVTSYFGGKKSIYQAYIDESRIGTIAKIHEENSNEPNGVLITIAVDKNDIYSFKDTAIKFYLWFDPTPVFYGVNITNILKEKLASYKIYHESDNCILYQEPSYYERNKVYCKMGNICYPVETSNGIDIGWLNNSGYNLIVKVDIGEVSFTTSREQLELTDMTVKNLNKRISLLRNELALKYKTQINACATPWDAMCLYNDLPVLIKSLLSKKLMWNNVELNPSVFETIDWSYYWESNRQWKASYGIKPNKNEKFALIFADGGYPSSQLRPRLMQARAILMAEKTGADAYNRIVYAKASVNETQAFLNRKEIEGVRIIKLSEVQPMPSKDKAVKKKEKVFKWNGSKSFPYSTCWDAVEIDEEATKIYVEIDCFRPVDYNWEQLIAVINLCKEIGVNIELYGTKKGAKLDDTWIKLQSHLIEEVMKRIASEEFKTSYINNRILNGLTRNSFMNNVLAGVYDKQADRINCPLTKKMVSLKVKRDVYPAYNTLTLLIRDIAYIPFADQKDIVLNLCGYANINDFIKELDNKANTMIESYLDDAEKIEKMYPLVNLKNLGSYYSYNIDASKAPMIVDYINAMYHVNGA